MKNKKQLYILVAVFAVLAILAYILTNESGEKTASYKLDKKFFEVDSAKVDKLEIEKKGVKVVLEKSGINWVMSAPVKYAAYEQFIAGCLGDLKNYTLTSIASTNPQNKDKFGFNDSAIVKLTVYEAGNILGTILIGKAGAGASQTYIKKPDSDEIFLADKFLQINFVKDNWTDWRNKRITGFMRSEIKSVDLISKDESFTLTQDSTSKWTIGKDSVNAAQLEGLLNILGEMNTQSFYDSPLPEGLNSEYKVVVKTSTISEVNFYPYEKEGVKRYYLTVTGVNQVFDVDDAFIKNLFKARKDFTVK